MRGGKESEWDCRRVIRKKGARGGGYVWKIAEAGHDSEACEGGRVCVSVKR